MKCYKITDSATGQSRLVLTIKDIQTKIGCTYNYAAQCIRRLGQIKFVTIKGWLVQEVNAELKEIANEL